MIVAGVTYGWMPFQKLDDLLTGQRLIFEKAFGQRFKILAFLADDPRCIGKASLYQTAHFRVNFLGGSRGAD